MSNISIEIIRPTICGGRSVSRGEVVLASVADARRLIALKKAVPSGIQTKMDSAAHGDDIVSEATSAWDADDDLQAQFPDVSDYLESLRR